MIEVSTFRARFPEYSDIEEYPDARIDLFIEDSVIYMGDIESHWQNSYNYAQAYLTAHLLNASENMEAGDTGSHAGSIVSTSAGGVSVSRDSVAKDRSDFDAFLMSSAYGQHYINTRNMLFSGVRVIV